MHTIEQSLFLENNDACPFPVPLRYMHLCPEGTKCEDFTLDHRRQWLHADDPPVPCPDGLQCPLSDDINHILQYVRCGGLALPSPSVFFGGGGGGGAAFITRRATQELVNQAHMVSSVVSDWSEGGRFGTEASKR